MKDYMKEVKK